jgi:DNA polymerase-1
VPELSLGTARLWSRALSSLEKLAALPPPVVAKPQRTRVSTRRVVVEDPLGIQLLGPGPVIRPQPGEGCDYQRVTSIAELREYLRPCFEQKIPFGADWETSSLNPYRAMPVGLSVSVGPKSARYVSVGHMLTPEANLSVMEVLAVLQELDALGVYSIWYNASYDLEVMWNALKWEPLHWHDAQIAVFLINSNVIELNLKATAMRLLGEKMQTIEELDAEWIILSQKAKKEREPKRPHDLPADTVTPYGCADADCTLRIWHHPDAVKARADQPLIFQLEEQVIPVLREGIRHGVYLDVTQLRALQMDAKARIDALLPEIYRLMECEPFPLSKRAVLGEKLFELKAIGYVETNSKSPDHGQWTVQRGKEGKVTTAKKVLDKYRRQHPVIPLLIQYNELEAQERMYIRKLIKAAEYFATQPWAQGRSRFAFNSIGVPTGRMKCGGSGRGGEAYGKGMVDVNGQSLPDHEKAPYLPNTRSAIVAPPGYVVLAADYSQIELRIPANIAQETKWIEAFNTGQDIHLTNAQLITNVREPGVVVAPDDKKRRGAAKSTSFALLYGGDENTISRNAGIPIDESKQILDAFFKGLPRLKAWVDAMHASARSNKQVRTFLGRIRHLEQYFLPEPSRRDFQLWKAWKKLDARGCREAINDPIQGGAADIFKLACVLLRRAVQQQGWGLDIISPQIYWVHDEVVWYVKQEWVTRVVPVLRQAMEFEIKGWQVPLKAEFEVSSRKLYAQQKATKARKDGKVDEAAQWDLIAAGPEHHNYGELVDLDTWAAVYAAGSVTEAA